MQTVAPPACSSLEHLHQRFAALRIQIAGRLVGEQDRRTSGDGPRDRDELLVSAGQRAGPLLRARSARPTRSSAASTRACRSAGRHAAQRQRILDVLVDGHVADQIEALEDQADVEVADARPLGRATADRSARPFSQYAPAVGVSRSARIERNVDLPHPDGPETETYSPRAMSTVTSSSARVSSSASPFEDSLTCSSRMTGMSGPGGWTGCAGCCSPLRHHDIVFPHVWLDGSARVKDALVFR